jgi:phosphatidylglycerol:prolipoprotein diacylglycerol transferase
MLAFSFTIGMIVAARRARNRGIDPEHIYSLSLVILVTSLVGARLFHFLFHYALYARSGNPFLKLLRVKDGGLMVLGGFVFAMMGSVIYLWHKKLPVLEITDIVAPSVALGSCFTRMGCFLNGCCYGKPTDSWLGMTFPTNSPIYHTFITGIEPGTPVWPTQLMESVAGLAMFGILLLIDRYRKEFHGMIFGLLIVLFAGWRLFIEKYRFREVDMHAFAGVLSKNQVISILLILAGVAVMIWGYTATRRSAKQLYPSGATGQVKPHSKEIEKVKERH